MIKVDGIKLAITESEDLLKIKACKKANVNILISFFIKSSFCYSK